MPRANRLTRITTASDWPLFCFLCNEQKEKGYTLDDYSGEHPAEIGVCDDCLKKAKGKPYIRTPTTNESPAKDAKNKN